APASGGVLSLGAGRARLQVDATGAPAAAADLYSMLTVSAALLLAAPGRAPVHAAAGMAPGGDAWLLAGGARAGQPTTGATVAAAGALARVVRQSPWLLACRRTAPAALALLTRPVADGALALRLGRDTYRDAARLAASLGALDLVLTSDGRTEFPRSRRERGSKW